MEDFDIDAAVDDLVAYGTSEGVEKAWDTRGRGRAHPNRDVHIYGEKAPKERAVVQKIFDSLPERHKNLLRDQNLLVYVVNKPIKSPDGHIRGGYTEKSQDLPLKMKLPTSVSLGNNSASLSSGMFKEIATHEFGHAFADSGGMNKDDWQKYGSIYNEKSKLSDRARDGMEEHFAEAYGTYLRNPERLQRLEPAVYEFLKERFEDSKTSDALNAAVDSLMDEIQAHCGNDNAPIGTKATGYSEPELGPFLCLNCVHSNREGNRCNHPDVVADPEMKLDDGAAVIEPAACCNEFHPRHGSLEAHGTSEGVKKEWDERGRGRKDDADLDFQAHKQALAEYGLSNASELRKVGTKIVNLFHKREAAIKAELIRKITQDKALDAAIDELFGEALFHGVRIEGFSSSDEEFVRATLSRVPPELLTHVKVIESNPGLEPKHGRYDPDTETVNLSPHDFHLRERLGKGPGWMQHPELTIVHEVGHSVYTFLPEHLKDEWRAISGWMVGRAPGQAPAYRELRPGWPHKTSKMTHKTGVKFTRKYAERNDDEDFADSFAFAILGKGHQMDLRKRKFLENLLSTIVTKYSQTSIQSPSKAYGELGNG